MGAQVPAAASSDSGFPTHIWQHPVLVERGALMKDLEILSWEQKALIF